MIEVGDFVRINKDFRIICVGIGKVVNKNKDTIYVKMSNSDLPISFNRDSIVNHSKNIIDLIEVGDYVNGYKVDFVQNNEIIYNHNHPYKMNMFAKDIKSIETKEQFASMEYKIEEDK